MIIDQAKGVLATRAGISTDVAFTVPRSHARGQGMRLTALARAVVAGTVDLTAVVRPALRA